MTFLSVISSSYLLDIFFNEIDNSSNKWKVSIFLLQNSSEMQFRNVEESNCTQVLTD